MNLNRRIFLAGTTLCALSPSLVLPNATPVPATVLPVARPALEIVQDARLKMKIRADIDAIYLEHSFEPKDDITRRSIVSMVTDCLQTLYVDSRLVYAFKVVCDETNNTPMLIDSGAPIALDVYVQPARVIETWHFSTRPTLTGTRL